MPLAARSEKGAVMARMKVWVAESKVLTVDLAVTGALETLGPIPEAAGESVHLLLRRSGAPRAGEVVGRLELSAEEARVLHDNIERIPLKDRIVPQT